MCAVWSKYGRTLAANGRTVLFPVFGKYGITV